MHLYTQNPYTTIGLFDDQGFKATRQQTWILLDSFSNGAEREAPRPSAFKIKQKGNKTNSNLRKHIYDSCCE